MVQKYIGNDDSSPQVDRLGGTAWNKTKKKVKTSMKVMAKELLAVYASRTVLQGSRFLTLTTTTGNLKLRFLMKKLQIS